MKRKIAVDCREFRKGKSTGIGRFLEMRLTHGPLIRRDWDFLLLGDSETEIPFNLAENVSFRRVSGGPRFSWDQFKLPLEIRKEKCDLFFSPYYKTCFFSPVPSVITIHDLTNLIYPGYVRAPSLYRALMRLYAASSSAVLTVSGNSKLDIVRVLGLPPQKVVVNHNGVDLSVFRESAEAAARAKVSGILVPYLLYVGNSRPHKNVDALVSAFVSLSPDVRDKRALVLAGVGDYEPPVGMDQRSIIKIPYVSGGDLTALYGAAELFVFPSLYEGFGLPPLEAMACGCPVAASRTSCLPEILGDACAYFDPTSFESIRGTLSALLKSPASLNELRIKGRERVKNYGAIPAAKEWVSLLDKVLSGGLLKTKELF